MRFAQEISIFNPNAIELAVVALGTRITQTAEEIRLEAAQTLTNYSTTVQMNAAISQRANEITSEVSETYATIQSLNNNVSSLSTRITQNTTSISTEVTNRTKADNTLSSRIEQTATAISFTLSGGGTGTNRNKASLSMTYTKEDGSKISLAAQTITFNGLVTFTDLSTSGSTTINGNNITTGTIKDADGNTTFNLSNGTLTMKRGSINLGNGTFSVTNAGKLTASDIYINAPLRSTGSRVYAYDIGGANLNMGEGSYGDATFFVSIANDRVWTRPIFWIDRTGGLKGGIVIDSDSDGNGTYKRLRATNGLKVSGEGGEGFKVGTYSAFTEYAEFRGGYGGGSDRRIKQDIKPLDVDVAVQNIMSLKPVRFAYKSDPKYTQHGFIAQDVQSVVHDWDVVREGTSGMLCLSYNDFIADLVATVQYQNRRIEALECMVSG